MNTDITEVPDAPGDIFWGWTRARVLTRAELFALSTDELLAECAAARADADAAIKACREARGAR